MRGEAELDLVIAEFVGSSLMAEFTEVLAGELAGEPVAGLVDKIVAELEKTP